MEELRQPSLEQVQEAFKQDENSPEIQTLLRTLYGEAVETKQADNRPVTERIKTFEDACRELGTNHPLVLQYEFNYNAECGWNDNADTRDFSAYLKLRIICAALNEGWKPKFTEDEWRYYPWFWLYTQEEIDRMDEEERQDLRMMRTGDYQTGYAGFACAFSSNAPSGTNAHFGSRHFGSRLCLKSDTLAVYCGNQFIDLWADFYLIRK